MDLIDRQALINELNNSHHPGAPYIDAGISIAIWKVFEAPTIEPEIMPDGTLHVTVNADVASIDRILLSQAGTHSGDLYYKDNEKPERKTGKWIWQTWSRYMCSECGWVTNVDECMEKPMYIYCPYCGAKMEGGEQE